MTRNHTYLRGRGDFWYPPEDGDRECLECGGTCEDESGGVCKHCNGTGMITADGDPAYPVDEGERYAEQRYWRG